MTIRTKVSGVTQHPIQLHEFLANTKISQSGIAEGFAVSEQSPQALGVEVALGRAFLRKDDGSIVYPAWSDSDEELTINANGSGNPRIDSIVLYYDEGAGSPAVDGSLVAKLIVVQGTSAASPVAPDDSAIISAMGGDYPYIILANVDVASGASVITDANITDTREDFIFDVDPQRPTTQKTSIVDADELTLFDSASIYLRKSITWSNLKSAILSYLQGVTSSLLKDHDDWQDSDYTLTYVDSDTIKVTGSDVTSIFKRGTRVRFTNDGSTKYGTVEDSSFSTDTTIELAVEVSLVSGAITNPQYSYSYSPQGYKTPQEEYKVEGDLTVDQTISDSVITKLDFESTIDRNGNWSDANNEYTSPLDYSFNIGGTIIRDSGPTWSRAIILAYVDGVEVWRSTDPKNTELEGNEFSSLKTLLKGEDLDFRAFIDVASGSPVIRDDSSFFINANSLKG